MRMQTILRPIVLVGIILTAACSDSSTAPGPVPGARVSIAAPAVVVYETDAAQFTATVRDAAGSSLPGAVVSWTVSDPTRAEFGANGVMTALRPDPVSITASSEGASSTFHLTIAPLTVERVIVMSAMSELAIGDITPIGVKVEGPGERVVPGRLVAITSDNPAVATIDAAGRVRAVGVGEATIRAVADGVTGTKVVKVVGEPALFELRRLSGAQLPLLVATDTVQWNGVTEYHEVYMESGQLRLTGGAQPRYEMDIRYAEYNVVLQNGQRNLQLRTTQRSYDRGVVAYDSRGDLQMTSEYISPLSHTAAPVTGGMQVRFRVPGDDDVLELFYRREPL
ncbi:MAG: Ig-like domain-containing protein [Gemmatimonadota bacterium]